jgi:hypothetical protein
MDVKAELTTAMESLVTALVAACANPRPSYSLDGQSVSWEAYVKMLIEGIKSFTELIALFDINITVTNII